MRSNEIVVADEKKKAYVKPQLVLHGSVQKLTEGLGKGPGFGKGPGYGTGSNSPIPIWGGW